MDLWIPSTRPLDSPRLYDAGTHGITSHHGAACRAWAAPEPQRSGAARQARARRPYPFCRTSQMAFARVICGSFVKDLGSTAMTALDMGCPTPFLEKVPTGYNGASYPGISQSCAQRAAVSHVHQHHSDLTLRRSVELAT